MSRISSTFQRNYGTNQVNGQDDSMIHKTEKKAETRRKDFLYGSFDSRRERDNIYIKNLQEQIYYLESEAKMLRTQSLKVNEYKPKVIEEASNMLLLLQEKDEIIKNMDLKIAQLQSRINLMESDSTYKKHIEIEMEDRHHHNESNHISELVNLKKNIKNLEENFYIEKNHYRKLLLVNKELEVKIDILQNNSRESEKDIDSLKMRINEIQMEKDDMSNNLLEKTQEMDIKNYENENMSQTLHEKIAEQYRNRLSELELVNLDLIQKTDKDKAIITQLSAKNEMLRIENAQHKNGLFENSEILKTERDINRKIKTDCIKYEKMNTDIISQLSCEKKCIENQKNHITTLSKQIENVEEQLSDKQNLLNDKNDLIKNLQNQIEKLSQYKNIKDKLQNVDLYTLSDVINLMKLL